MKTYHVFHVVDAQLKFTAEVNQERTYVGNVEAVSLNDAFMKTQNIEGNEEWPRRSTSVGDLIQVDDQYYLVKGIGFEAIDILDLVPAAQSNPGYVYLDSEGQPTHTWDFEESIGE